MVKMTNMRIYILMLLVLIIATRISSASPYFVSMPEPNISVSGNGQQVVLVELDAGIAIFNLTYDGTSSELFHVTLQDTRGDYNQLFINLIKPFSGSAFVHIAKGGLCALQIEGGGNWSINIIQPNGTSSSLYEEDQEIED